MERSVLPSLNPDVELPVEAPVAQRMERPDAERLAKEREFQRLLVEREALAVAEEKRALALAEKLAETRELSRSATQDLIVKFAWGFFAGAVAGVVYRMVRA